MVKIMKFLAYTLFFILALIAFLPKENLFFLLEKELAKQEVFISNEVIATAPFSMQIEDAFVSYKGIEAAKIEKTELLFLLFYNEIVLNNIELVSLVRNYWPSKVESVVIHYSVVNPLKIKTEAKGEFGEIEAQYLLSESKVRVVLKPSKLLLSRYRRTLRYFKKLQTGEYIYEKAL